MLLHWKERDDTVRTTRHGMTECGAVFKMEIPENERAAL
jgi:hypothetical protein